MGLTQKLGTIPLAIFTDASNNIGIGGSPSGSYKFEVTGTGRITSTLLIGGNTSITSTSTDPVGLTITGGDEAFVKLMQGAGALKNWGIITSNLGASDFGIYQSTSNGGDPFTAGTPKLYINGSGNVGIGTSSPTNILHTYATLPRVIADTSTRFAVFNLYYQGAEKGALVLDNQNKLITLEANGDNTYETRFVTGGSERMRITSGGNVGINGFDTGVQLYVKSTTSTSSDYPLYIANTTSGIFYIRSDGFIMTGTAASSPYNNTTGSGANLFVSSGGVLQRSTSSLKYKTDVRDYDKGLSEVMQMRPVYYKGKNDGDTQYAGLIAEEINDLGLVEFVQYAEDETPDALYYANMIALMTKAIQELNAKVSALENKS